MLFDVEGHSIREISGFQGVSESAVKSRLARGRERLRRHYERILPGLRVAVSHPMKGVGQAAVAPEVESA